MYTFNFANLNTVRVLDLESFLAYKYFFIIHRSHFREILHYLQNSCCRNTSSFQSVKLKLANIFSIASRQADEDEDDVEYQACTPVDGYWKCQSVYVIVYSVRRQNCLPSIMDAGEYYILSCLLIRWGYRCIK